MAPTELTRRIIRRPEELIAFQADLPSPPWELILPFDYTSLLPAVHRAIEYYGASYKQEQPVEGTVTYHLSFAVGPIAAIELRRVALYQTLLAVYTLPPLLSGELTDEDQHYLASLPEDIADHRKVVEDRRRQNNQLRAQYVNHDRPVYQRGLLRTMLSQLAQDAIWLAVPEPARASVVESEGRTEPKQAGEGDDNKPGRPGLEGEELLYRLAKAQEGEAIKAAQPGIAWSHIARKIGWRFGSEKSGIKLLEDARKRLERADAALLAEVADYRERTRKEKN